jgi:hypothetical protein
VSRETWTLFLVLCDLPVNFAGLLVSLGGLLVNSVLLLVNLSVLLVSCALHVTNPQWVQAALTLIFNLLPSIRRLKK